MSREGPAFVDMAAAMCSRVHSFNHVPMFARRCAAVPGSTGLESASPATHPRVRPRFEKACYIMPVLLEGMHLISMTCLDPVATGH
jgi:hypothetical protein